MVIKALGKVKKQHFFIYSCLKRVWFCWLRSLWQSIMTGPSGNSSFCFQRNSMFLGKQNELFPEGPVFKRFVIQLEIVKLKFIKPRCNGGCRSTVHCHPLTSLILQCCPLRDFGGKQFHCLMSCDLEVTNESARCWEKISSYITMHFNNRLRCTGSGILVKGL